MSNNIQDKVVVITGASSGLGEETARHLVGKGAKLVLAARRTERLQKLVNDIQAAGGKAIAVTTDVAKQTDVEHLIKQALDTFGRIDVMVNNAGYMAVSPLSNRRVAEWDRMIDINIKGVLYGIAAVLPSMQAQKSGHIINISSIAGLRVSVGATAYSATKFAVKAISEGLRAEVASDNIRVTTIYPGAIATELPQGTTDPQVKALVEKLYAEKEISADSIARAIAYAIEQPEDVSVNEITVRPTRQET